MEDNAKIELLVESAEDFAKSTLELVKLKVVDKTSDIISTIIPHSIVFIIVSSFLLFCNLGIVFLLGVVFGRIYLGFFAVAGFYLVLAVILHFFMHTSLKRKIYNAIIINLLK